MKNLFGIFGIILSVSFANAKSVTLDVVDELTYTELTAFKDGTRAVLNPKIYGYFFEGAYRGEAEDNASVICRMIGTSEVVHYASVLTGKGGLTTVKLKIENGKISEPRFDRGGDIETVVLGKVLCR